MFGDVVVDVIRFSSSLCSFSRVVKFSAGLTDISGLVVGAFDFIICSWSVFRSSLTLTLVSKRRKVNMGLCGIRML